MNRRQFVLASSVGITALAGCSGSADDTEQASSADTETRNEIVEKVRTAGEDLDQGNRDFGDARSFSNDERWGNAAGSARDAADSFSSAENEFNTAVSRAEGLGDVDLTSTLEGYQEFCSVAVQAATSFEQGCEAMIENDRDTAQSHFQQAKEYGQEMEQMDLTDRAELTEQIQSSS